MSVPDQGANNTSVKVVFSHGTGKYFGQAVVQVTLKYGKYYHTPEERAEVERYLRAVKRLRDALPQVLNSG